MPSLPAGAWRGGMPAGGFVGGGGGFGGDWGCSGGGSGGTAGLAGALGGRLAAGGGGVGGHAVHPRSGLAGWYLGGPFCAGVGRFRAASGSVEAVVGELAAGHVADAAEGEAVAQAGVVE